MDKRNDFIAKLDELYAFGYEIQMDYYENGVEDKFIDELENLMMHCEIALKIFNE